MAGQNGNGKAKDRTNTRRVVLERAKVLVLPQGTMLTAEQQKAVAMAAGVKSTTKVPVAEAWLVTGEFDGASKEKSIEAYAGKAGTPDAKVGAFRAVPVSAWKDGVEHVAPPQPLIEKKALA